MCQSEACRWRVAQLSRAYRASWNCRDGAKAAVAGSAADGEAEVLGFWIGALQGQEQRCVEKGTLDEIAGLG